MFLLFVFLRFYLFFRGKGEEKERERNIDGRKKHPSVASCLCPNGGLNPQPRHVLWLGIEPVTFRFVGWHLTNWATLVRAPVWFFSMGYPVFLAPLTEEDVLFPFVYSWCLYWRSVNYICVPLFLASLFGLHVCPYACANLRRVALILLKVFDRIHQWRHLFWAFLCCEVFDYQFSLVVN